MRKIMTAISIAALLGLAACNTVRGVGQDLQSAADTVDDAT